VVIIEKYCAYKALWLSLRWLYRNTVLTKLCGWACGDYTEILYLQSFVAEPVVIIEKYCTYKALWLSLRWLYRNTVLTKLCGWACGDYTEILYLQSFVAEPVVIIQKYCTYKALWLSLRWLYRNTVLTKLCGWACGDYREILYLQSFVAEPVAPRIRAEEQVPRILPAADILGHHQRVVAGGHRQTLDHHTCSAGREEGGLRRTAGLGTEPHQTRAVGDIPRAAGGTRWAVGHHQTQAVDIRVPHWILQMVRPSKNKDM
jgi:hypothetical protein